MKFLNSFGLASASSVLLGCVWYVFPDIHCTVLLISVYFSVMKVMLRMLVSGFSLVQK